MQNLYNIEALVTEIVDDVLTVADNSEGNGNAVVERSAVACRSSEM